MKTKITVSGMLLAANFASLSGLSSQNKKQIENTKNPRPNILFIIADDASFAHFGANGCTWINTPAFDRVSREGINFANCYTPNAKSAPSRSCVLTGLYSWQSGAAANHLPAFPADLKVVTEALASNGYNVAFTGKGWGPGEEGNINGEKRLLTGQSFQSKKTKAPTTGINKTDYVANFKDFLNQNADNKPWFFWFGCYEPHRSYEFGSGERVGGLSKSSINNFPAYWPQTDNVKTDMLDYGFEIEYFDKQISGFLSELEKRGALDNTLIIITSDNGMPFPRSKGNSYEISTHMPLVVMWKNGISSPGRHVTDYVNFVDFTPTFLDVSRTDYKKSGMHKPQGESLNPIFKNNKTGQVIDKRNYVILGRERHDIGRPQNQGYPIRAIIHKNFLYIRNFKPGLWPAGNPETGYPDCDGSPTKTEILSSIKTGTDSIFYKFCFDFRPQEELYNLANDKDCINNLASSSIYQNIKLELKKKLYTDLKKQKDPRVCSDKEVFDLYPFFDPDMQNVYERVMSGEIQNPWEKTGWLNPTDYSNYKE